MSLEAPSKKIMVVFEGVIRRNSALDSSTSDTGELRAVQEHEGIGLKCEVRKPSSPAEASNSDSRPCESFTRSKSSLPCGVGNDEDTHWADVFIPTFLTYVGALPDAWKMKGVPAVKALQLIWDAVYHDRPYSVKG